MSTDRPQRPKWARGRPLIGAEVEELLLETMDMLEDAHEDLRTWALAARTEEAAYRVAYARAYFQSTQKTEESRRQDAVRRCEPILAKRKRAEAEEVAAAELCRIRRTDVEALRTLCASARAAETGRG